jgi:hypothetical protein
VSAVFASAFALSSCEPPRDAKPNPQYSELTKTQLFDLRTKCSDLARRAEEESDKQKKELPALAGGIDTYTNHYDPVENRCYLEEFLYHHQRYSNEPGEMDQSRMVSDVQQRGVIATCTQITPDREPPQVPACNDAGGQPIPLAKANELMNHLMGESIKWP